MTFTEKHRERFISMIQVQPNGCWTWTGKLTREGYANVSWQGVNTGHRIAYTLFVGPIPAGLALDHLCRTRACVRPDHLEPVTYKENSNRSPLVMTGTHTGPCPAGHPYPESFKIRPSGKRLCNVCNRNRGRINYAKGLNGAPKRGA